jgi:hypothetical protein
MALVADVQADEHGGYLFDNTSIFELATINGAHARDLGSQSANQSRGVVVVAAYDDIAIQRVIAVQQFGGEVVKCCRH